MTQQQVLIVGGGITLGVILAAVFFFSQAPAENSNISGIESTLSPIPLVVAPSESKKTYESDAGFSFSYPSDVDLEEFDLDQTTYADIELHSATVAGILKFRITDSKDTTASAWIATKNPAAKNTASDRTLDDIQGLEYVSENQILFAALDQGALFTIDIEPRENSVFWQTVYDGIVSSFAFVPPPDAPAQSAPVSSEEIIFEGEEIIE